jgi:hypothetical protein
MPTTRRYFTIFLLTLSLILQSHVVYAEALADSPAPEFDYIQEVGKGKFVFVMLSIKGDPTAYGQGGAVQDAEIRRQYSASGLYRKDDSTTPLWTVDWYAFQVALSSDGKYLIRWGPWPFHGNYDELALAFYKDGQELQQYTVKDLVAVPELLPRSVSHYGWEKQTSFDATTNVLHLETHTGETYDFDITSGEKLTETKSSLTNVVLLTTVGIVLFGVVFVLLKRFRNPNRSPGEHAA